ncbi:MAG: IS110 family transposase [bacterium]|nr:IS110 family transposase [bacterium]
MDRVAGIDVGKASLDVSLAGGPVRPFANTAAGRRSLRQWLGEQGVTLAVCEPTGGYERPLVGELQAVGLPVVLAHPPRVRAFARVCGTEAKTDLLDAQVLARFGVAVPVVATPPPDPARVALRDLVSRRRQLVETRTEEKNRQDKGQTPAVAQSTRRHLAWLEREIARLDAAIQQTVADSPELARRTQLYRSVRGVGEVTATILTAYLPELGQVSGKAVTALVGLAPWAHDSGRQRGYRAIRGGRGTVRGALYLAAMVAIRHPGELQRFYQGLRQRGKRGKVALVAVMRKLLLHLHAVARRGTPWIEELAPAPKNP